MAPELFTSKGYNGELSDVFALGVVLFALVMGRPPFRVANLQDELFRRIASNQFEEFWQFWDSYASRYGLDVPIEFKNLFTGMVSYFPSTRLSLNEVFVSKWVQD